MFYAHVSLVVQLGVTTCKNVYPAKIFGGLKVSCYKVKISSGYGPKIGVFLIEMSSSLTEKNGKRE